MTDTGARWPEQYERALRWIAKVRKTRDEGHIDGEQPTSDAYSDEAHAMAQAIWHVNDWIKNDPTIPAGAKSNMYEWIKANSIASLGLMADVANSTKHLELTRGRWRDGSNFGGRQHRLNTMEGGPEGSSVTYSCSFTIVDETRPEDDENRERDAVEVAEECIADWDRYLTEELGLTPPSA